MAFAHVSGQVAGSSNSSGTNAPSSVPPIQAIGIGDVISQLDSTSTQLQDEQKSLADDPVTQTAESRLPILTKQIDSRLEADKNLLQSDPTLADIQNSQSAWTAPGKDLDVIKGILTLRANQNSALLSQLGQQTQTWQATLAAAKAHNAPADGLDRIRNLLSSIATTTQSAQTLQNQILSIQSQISDQQLRITTGTGNLAKAQDSAQQALLQRDHLPLWAGSLSSLTVAREADEADSLEDQLASVKAYLQEKLAVVSLQLLSVILLTFGLHAMREAVRIRTEKDPALQNAERLFAWPFATAILLSLLASAWLYPLPPRLLWSAIGIIGLVPTLIILRKLLEPSLFPVVYALVVAYFLDQVRHVLIPAGPYTRILLIVELIAGCLFILWLLRSKPLASQFAGARFEPWVRVYFHITFWIFVFAGTANLLGYVNLSNLVGNGMLRCCYLTVVVYAAVQIVDALILSALSIPPLSRFRAVDSHRNLIYGKMHVFIHWMALALWLVGALQLFTLRDPGWHLGERILNHTFRWGSIAFSLGDVAAFGLTVWASFLVSRFLRFILAEEVYPNLSLGRGIPYAASTMVHYTILVMGFFTALGALGIDLTKFSVLAGAFGVGLGFGLQNIMNNFVSGIILLFERPIKVGDTLQMDASTGVVESIGIRASIIRLSNGSSVIVPNGNLISAPVTNWSLTNNSRMIEIPIAVGAKVDPEHMINLLVGIAKENKDVLENPTPQAFLVTLAGTGLAFRLRAWVDSDADWAKVTSELSLAINSSLSKENIPLS